MSWKKVDGMPNLRAMIFVGGNVVAASLFLGMVALALSVVQIGWQEYREVREDCAEECYPEYSRVQHGQCYCETEPPAGVF